jgi:phosphatidylinositol kinase/protein kinase (PI-3  family)
VAQERFIRSLAGYCLFGYFCEVKDRHNGNILVHRSGCLIHIDFTYSLGHFPGKLVAV